MDIHFLRSVVTLGKKKSSQVYLCFTDPFLRARAKNPPEPFPVPVRIATVGSDQTPRIWIWAVYLRVSFCSFFSFLFPRGSSCPYSSCLREPSKLLLVLVREVCMVQLNRFLHARTSMPCAHFLKCFLVIESVVNEEYIIKDGRRCWWERAMRGRRAPAAEKCSVRTHLGNMIIRKTVFTFLRCCLDGVLSASIFDCLRRIYAPFAGTKVPVLGLGIARSLRFLKGRFW